MQMPNAQVDAALLDLDTRHDNILLRLNELDKQVEQVLTECLSARERGASQFAREDAAPADHGGSAG